MLDWVELEPLELAPGLQEELQVAQEQMELRAGWEEEQGPGWQEVQEPHALERLLELELESAWT